MFVIVMQMASTQLKIQAPTTSSSRSRLVSKLYGDEVLCALRSLQQNDMLCDFTVTAEGKSLRVSMINAVQSQMCPVFIVVYDTRLSLF